MSGTGTLHDSSQITIQHLYDRVVMRWRIEGDFTDVATYANNVLFGAQADSGGYLDGIAVPKDGTVFTGISAVRTNGGSGFADVEFTAFRNVCVFGYDMACVSKPILSFRYKGESNSEVNARAKKLQAWQSLRDQSQWNEDYVEYSYRLPGENGAQQVHTLTGRDLEVAQKIVRGVESFDMYYPIVSRTRTSAIPFTDDLDMIGHPDTPSIPSGWICHGDPGQLVAFLSKKSTWVKTADVISTNHDSSFTRREQWTGVDELDYDLYPPL